MTQKALPLKTKNTLQQAVFTAAINLVTGWRDILYNILHCVFQLSTVRSDDSFFMCWNLYIFTWILPPPHLTPTQTKNHRRTFHVESCVFQCELLYVIYIKLYCIYSTVCLLKNLGLNYRVEIHTGVLGNILRFGRGKVISSGDVFSGSTASSADRLHVLCIHVNQYIQPQLRQQDSSQNYVIFHRNESHVIAWLYFPTNWSYVVDIGDTFVTQTQIIELFGEYLRLTQPRKLVFVGNTKISRILYFVKRQIQYLG